MLALYKLCLIQTILQHDKLKILETEKNEVAEQYQYLLCFYYFTLKISLRFISSTYYFRTKYRTKECRRWTKW